jgi:hypothetical protein
MLPGPAEVREPCTRHDQHNRHYNRHYILWQQSDNVPFEQSRNVPLTAPSFGDAGRTTTNDPGR